MTLHDLLQILDSAPLVASVQAPPDSPVNSPDPLRRLALASLMNGVNVLRLQGTENIGFIKPRLMAPVIGLIKRDYRDSEIYITPTRKEVEALLELDCEVVALDGTPRPRPNGESLADLVALIHQRGKLAMADCDCIESARYAVSCGADVVGTTLAGYTKESHPTNGPDLDLLRAACQELSVPVIAEGRYAHRWQVEAALRIGAVAVVIGGALNDPFKTTAALLPRRLPNGETGAFDIGGTWLRFARFQGLQQVGEVERTPLPANPEERLAWMRERAIGLERVGVSTGGTVDPSTGEVWEAKPIIPGHQGTTFSLATLGVPTIALNDGLATSWAHAMHPAFAGKRVATLALGTGVGCGLVADGRIWMGPRGEYIRLNDLLATGGETYEDLLGGAALTPNPSAEDQARAIRALESAVQTIRNLYFPEEIVVAGGVGLSPWLAPHLDRLNLRSTPYGPDAGLVGAAALAAFPPA